MIQFNLLPDVKLQYIKAARTKRLVITGAFLAVVVVLAILAFLSLVVFGAQGRHLSNLNKDVETYTNELTQTEDINKILTIQNQLNSLPALHEQKPAATRLFGYLSQITPTAVTLSDVNVNFAENSVELGGQAPSLQEVNKYVDTIKFTNYKTSESEENKPAFTEVVLTSFGRTVEGASYQVSFKFDPEIFNNTKQVTLEVPSLTSTRSEVEKPEMIDTLFREQPQGGTQ